ncbi:hypothetical protein KC354_g3437 [Hortaea werneckii]|nr:hypothetical protein KC354_g3437 [Hortaea werneckii]
MDVHLCVLIHGLWGDPSHMLALQEALRSRYPHQSLQFLITKSNAKAKTYDGICIGGERAAHEIEHCIHELSCNGLHTRRISIVGYSMGGLIARYAIGVLFQNRLFDFVQPANFTTFATPHIGASVKVFGGIDNLIDNFVSQRLSATGQQLFLVDDHLGTGKPLLYLLAERDSIFDQGLSCFQRFAAYGNITGDYCVPYTTAAFDLSNPWAELLPGSGQKDTIKHANDATVKDVSEGSSRAESTMPSRSSHAIRQVTAYTAFGIAENKAASRREDRDWHWALLHREYSRYDYYRPSFSFYDDPTGARAVHPSRVPSTDASTDTTWFSKRIDHRSYFAAVGHNVR